jgi:hypothetical protein
MASNLLRPSANPTHYRRQQANQGFVYSRKKGLDERRKNDLAPD